MSDKDLSKQEKIIVALLVALVLSLGWGHWLPESAQTRGVRVSKGALTKASFSRNVPKYDLVVSHYSEDIDTLADTIKQITNRLKGTSRVIIYSKGDRDQAGLEELLQHADEVVPLKNVGREGETYLHHIARHYETGATSFADQTLFLQPHLAWDWILLPRVESIRRDTGFLSFGPYNAKTCTHDNQNLGFPRMADIYSSFQGTLCPPGEHLSTWAGQFLASRKRILDNPLRNYQNLIDLFNAPKDHWMWKEGWGNNEPSNPTLGHVLERSWPVIFNCTDVQKADSKICDGNELACQCLDE